MTTFSERTIRRNNKWAKISHLGHARYVIAYGWRGKLEAHHKHRVTNSSDATWSANSWLDE
jgi:hypothetical protein